MNYKNMVVISLIFILIFSIGVLDSEAADKVYKWKIASIYSDPATSKTFNSLGLAQQKFVELVEEKTNGQVVIRPFYNSVLGGNLELFEQVRRGELEVYYGQPMASIDERFGAWSIPYIFSNYEEVEKVACGPDGELFELSRQWMKENGAKLLAVGAGVFRGFANSKHPVKEVSDLSDLKVRIYQDPIVSIFWKNICIAAPIAYSEVYTALQTGAVDGLEFPAPSIIGGNLYEVLNYYANINWQWTSGANLVVSEKHWNQLPEDLKVKVQEAATEAMKYQGEVQKADGKKAFTELEKRGIEVYRLTSEERKDWIEYARSLDNEFKNAIGEEVFAKVINIVENAKK